MMTALGGWLEDSSHLPRCRAKDLRGQRFGREVKGHGLWLKADCILDLSQNLTRHQKLPAFHVKRIKIDNNKIIKAMLQQTMAEEASVLTPIIISVCQLMADDSSYSSIIHRPGSGTEKTEHYRQVP